MAFTFYVALRDFLISGTLDPSLDKKKFTRVANNFLVRENQLFYTGPSRQYMRLVVLSEDQKKNILQECHNNPGTGNHCGVRATRNKVIAGYYWSTINTDVEDWVRCCHRCQLNDPIKTVPPLLHPIKVTEPWDVLGMDLIGPLISTERSNQYVLTITDLYTKWVMAEPLQAASAVNVATALVGKLYLFGMVRKIISDRGREFVNELNQHIFAALGIKHAVSSAYHPQTNGQDERTNQNVKRALRRYVNEDHNDWDLHLQAIVYGINVSKQRSTQYSPYFLMFHRNPRLPEVLNACQTEETFVIGDPEEQLEKNMKLVKALNEKVCSNIQNAQAKQKKTFEAKKRRNVRQCALEAGDAVLIGETPLKRKRGSSLQHRHQGPFMLTSVSSKGVATVKMEGKIQSMNVSRLRPYFRPKDQKQSGQGEHAYAAGEWQVDHLYSSQGPMWSNDLGPRQHKLLSYVLDKARPGQEILVLDGELCLRREDFWTLGLEEQVESNIGNVCLKIAGEAAKRNGMDVHIMDLYTVPMWKTGQACLPESVASLDALVIPAWSRQPNKADHYMLCVLLVKKREAIFLDSMCPDGFGDVVYRTIFRWLAGVISPGPWVEKTGKDFSPFPLQSDTTSCGIFMLTYAFCICTGRGFEFADSDITSIRRWWCLKILETFSIERHGQQFGQRFAFWTEEAKQLIGGTLLPIYRVPRPHQEPVQVEPIEEDPLSPLILDMYEAHSVVVNNPELFTGLVREPSYMVMDQQDKANAEWHGRYTTAWGVMEPFTFLFETREDTDVFWQVCEDGMRLKVCCGWGALHPPEDPEHLVD